MKNYLETCINIVCMDHMSLILHKNPRKKEYLNTSGKPPSLHSTSLCFRVYWQCHPFQLLSIARSLMQGCLTLPSIIYRLPNAPSSSLIIRELLQQCSAKATLSPVIICACLPYHLTQEKYQYVSPNMYTSLDT